MDILLTTDQIFTPSVVLITVDTLAELASVSAAEIRLFLSLILAYPIALTWRAMPSGPSAIFRHIFSVVTGIWMLQFINGYQALFNLGSVLLCYFFMWCLGPQSARFVSLLAMTILACGHLYRQITDYLGWTLDWTLIAMVTTQKIMGLAYNVQDGLDENATVEQKSRSLPKLPSLLHFLSFILFPANLAIGPAFEYADYIDFATGIKVSPPPYIPGIWRLLQGLFFFVAHTGIALKFPLATLLSNERFFRTGTMLSRYGTMWIALLGIRFKYYFGWKIAEGSACMSGLGYAGVDKTSGCSRWNRVENVDVWKYETSQSLRMSSQNWNKTTNLWLRRYVYDRAPRAYNLYFTYLVSAFWHGFYPGYYMFFLSVAAATVVHRQVHRIIRPMFLAADGGCEGNFMRAYHFISAIGTSVALNYFIVSFVLLGLDKSIVAFRGFHFFGHWLLLTSLVLFKCGIIKRPLTGVTKNAEKKE